MASKFLNKIGVGKKHKLSFEVKTQPPEPTHEAGQVVVRDSAEYSLPPDCQPEDNIYQEPADSLSPASTSLDSISISSTASSNVALSSSILASSSSSTAASVTTTTVTTIATTITTTNNNNSSAANTLQSSIQDKTSPVSTLLSNASKSPDSFNTPDVPQVASKLPAALAKEPTTPTDMAIVSQIDCITSSSTMVSLASVDSSAMLESNSGASSHSTVTPLVHSEVSTPVYMNNSEVWAVDSRPPLPLAQTITPDIDPRNIHYPAAGNEYEAPWDLQSEINAVVKKMKQPLSSTAGNSSKDLIHQPGGESNPSLIASKTVGSQAYTNSEPATGLKVDYNTRRSNSMHRVKQSGLHRQSSTTSSKHMASGATTPSVSAVLVEGKWREAKPPALPAVSPSSPEIPHAKQFLSQTSVGRPPAHSKDSNSATNFIYDKSNDSEIKVMQRYVDDTNKVPCAQPRLSLTAPPGDQVYENITDAKKKTDNHCEGEAVYEDPWDVEQVQQQILSELERKQKIGNTGSRRRKSSEEFTNERKNRSERSSQKNRGNDTAQRRMVPEGLHKLSPRAIPGGSPALPSTPPPSKTSQFSSIAPGQTHANKPVLVVHKTNTHSYPSERKGSISSRSGSIRKDYITETTYLSTRNHTFSFSGSYSAPTTPSDVPECQHRIGLGVNKSLTLTQQPWYHGSIQRNHAEELLRKQPDGSFLIRESSNGPKDKTLSLKNSSGFIHIKIVEQPDGTVILGQFSHPFKNIMDMVEYYSRHKVNIKGAEHTYLEIPVLRER